MTAEFDLVRAIRELTWENRDWLIAQTERLRKLRAEEKRDDETG